MLASIGANLTAYADISVSAEQTYSYVGRARNATGSSGDSNTATVTTPLTLPAAPGSVAATVSGSTVSITWVDNSGNECGFEIGFQTYSNKQKSWSSSIVRAGTANANATSFTHNPGAYTPAATRYQHSFIC